MNIQPPLTINGMFPLMSSESPNMSHPSTGDFGTTTLPLT